MRRIIFNEPQRVGEWVCERTGGVYSPVDSWAIGLERDGVLIAGVMYDHYNGKSVAMHVAGDGRRWMTREFLRVCFDYPFNQLGVQKIIGMVDSINETAQRFDEHLGFTHEATIQNAAPCGDLLIYSMTRGQCRFIEG